MKSLLRLLPYIIRYKVTLLWGAVTVVVSNLFTVVTPLLVGRAIDSIKDGLTNRTLQASDLALDALLIVGFTAVAGVMTFLTRQTIIVTSRKIEFDLRNDFLAHIQKLSLSYFQNTPTGDLMAHATNDIGAVRNVLGPGIMYPIDTLMTLMMVLTLMLVKDWSLALMALLPLPLVSIAVYRLGKIIHEKFEARQHQYSLLTTRAQENLSGIRVVKSYVREEYETGLFENLSLDYLKKNLVLAKAQSVMWPLMFLLVGTSLVIVIYVGGVQVIEHKITIGTLTAFLAYLSMLMWPMIAFGWVTNIVQQGAASMERLGKIFDTKPDITDSATAKKDIERLAGGIEFRNVSFTYAGAAQPTLLNINLTVAPGMTLAIVGYTGAGKTTLVNLLPRLYDVTEGELLIDGVNIKEIPVRVLRRNIGYVLQETIMENISYGTDGTSRERIHEAAEISQLGKDVSEFPQQFDTMLGERGITLSGGQKQRTSIARAVLRQPGILILDDALSAVDTFTEEEILRRLHRVMENRTSIIISHRISTVKNADQIIVLDKGAIVERGTHDELVAHGGIYASLHEKQLLEQQLESLA
jgi:ATP-binding cassette subfamily B protein